MSDPYQLHLGILPPWGLSAEAIADSDRIERWRNCEDRVGLDYCPEPDAPRCAGEHARPWLHDYDYLHALEREDERFTEDYR